MPRTRLLLAFLILACTPRGEVASLQRRDEEKYGNKDGPTWDWLVAKATAKGLSGDAVYLSIIESAQQTDEAVNKSLGL